jgi:2'-5' RNA ligase
VRVENALYFIAILLPSPYREEVSRLKEYFRDRYHSTAALRSPPHITLHMPFRWKTTKEDRLTDALQQFAIAHPPVCITLKHFGCFPPRVIFIDVQKNDELEALQRELKRFCRSTLNLEQADWRNQGFNPHVTLAFRDLKKSAFQEAWHEFGNKEFYGSFIADAITLLYHDGKQWIRRKDFLLKGTHITRDPDSG